MINLAWRLIVLYIAIIVHNQVDEISNEIDVLIDVVRGDF